jgi:hypothetical protein
MKLSSYDPRWLLNDAHDAAALVGSLSSVPSVSRAP